MTRYDLVVNHDEFTHLHKVFKNDKCGVFNSKTKKEEIPLIYDDVEILDVKLFAVKLGEFWGAIQNGNIIIPINYEDVFEGEDGYIVAETSNTISLFCKDTGNFSKPYETIYDFKNGYAIVGHSLCWGIISETLEEIVPTIYQALWHIKDNLFFAEIDFKLFLLDVKTNTLSSTEYSNLRCSLPSCFIVDKNNYCGIIDLNLNIVLPSRYNYITKIKDDFFRIGIITQNSRLKFGLFHLEKGWILECKYSDIYSVGDSNFAVRNSSGNVALFDLKGNRLTEFKYDKLLCVRDCLLTATKTKAEKLLFGVMNSKGKELISPIYDDVRYLQDGYVVKKDGKYGVCDGNCKLVSKIIYDEVTSINTYNKAGEKYARVVLNEVSGYFYW